MTAKQNGAAEVTVWGSGTPRREFLYVDDLADAVCFLMERYDSPEIINVGWGEDVTIAELARLIADIVGFRGTLALRPQQARRHAAQAARCRQDSRARLAGEHAARGRHPRNLRLVSRELETGARRVTRPRLQKTLTRAVVPPSHHATSLNVLK